MEIQTIADLKKAIESLPDDMPVMAYIGGNGDLVPISIYEHDNTFIIDCD